MASLRETESELAKGLRRLESRSPYAEVMAGADAGISLRLDKQTVSPQPVPALSGFVYRAWQGTEWVEAAASGLSGRQVEATVERLLAHLPGAPSGTPPPGPSATGRAERATPQQRPIADVALEELVEWARDRFRWATAVPGIENAVVSTNLFREERLFLSTAGAYRYQSLARTLGTVTPLAIEGGKVEFDYVQRGRCGGVEVLDTLGEEAVTKTARDARALLSAKSPPVGPMNVLLDPSTAGTFAHESFGHGTEADQILRQRSYLAPLLGQTLGPECLTLVDDGTFEGGWGQVYFDDEGNPGQKTVLVDHGKFVEVLHDRESAAALGRRPTGNTRRADFLSRPFVRMTNTYVEPGDRTLDELVREAKDGVLLEHFTSGIEDPLGGNMQLKVKRGRRIENGELTDILPSMALSGKVLDFLRSVRGVSRREDFDVFPGFCGKGHTDLLPTGAGGPYVLAHAVVGPG